MEQNVVTRVLADRIREVRRRRGLTAAQFAERMKAAGIGWDRGVVAKLETGRRQSIGVDEWLTAAYVLDVAPIHLLLPLDDDVQVAVLPAAPGSTLPVGGLRAWVSGYAPMPGQDPRLYWSEIPKRQWEAFEEAARREEAGEAGEVSRWLKQANRLKAIADAYDADREGKQGGNDDG